MTYKISYTPVSINKCSGEAHTNPYIDHCPYCIPHWGMVHRCPQCSWNVTINKQGYDVCRTCKTIFKTRKNYLVYTLRTTQAGRKPYVIVNTTKLPTRISREWFKKWGELPLQIKEATFNPQTSEYDPGAACVF